MKPFLTGRSSNIFFFKKKKRIPNEKKENQESSKDGGLRHLDGVVENIAILSSAFPDLMSWHVFPYPGIGHLPDFLVMPSIAENFTDFLINGWDTSK